jgi:predicted NUDIX family phosphoesterase
MEFVYVVKRYDLFERSFPHGLQICGEDDMAPLLARIAEHGFFVERRHAELDSTMKQIIPYCVVARGQDVFLTRRLAAGGEARLHGKRSIGIGGHVNPVDGVGGSEGGDVLREGLRRELDEELVIGGSWNSRPVGILNDDSTDVGSVHLGLVSVVDVDGDVAVRETEALEGEFVGVDELERLCREERGSFETWSALVIDRLPQILA